MCPRCGAKRSDDQLGLEPDVRLYVARLVEVFREVRRVLAPHGTAWVNLGDTYAANRSYQVPDSKHLRQRENRGSMGVPTGLKEKDVMMVPARVAIALCEDGWYLRSEIIWHKPNPLPESVTDRPTKSHEMIYMLAKNRRYFFDQEAGREPAEWARWGDQTTSKHYGTPTAGGWMEPKTKSELQRRRRSGNSERKHGTDVGAANGTDGDLGRGVPWEYDGKGRNMRDVWTIPTQSYKEAHFATFPEELVRKALLVACPERVCRTCGAPSERIIERVETDETQKMADGWATHEGGHGSIHRDGREAGASGKPVMAAKTVGFTDCGHGSYECVQCGIVLDYDEVAIQAENHRVSTMRGDQDDHRERGSSPDVLFEDMLEPVDRCPQELIEGLCDHEGLSTALASGPPDVIEVGLRDGAPVGGVGEHRPHAVSERGRTPSKRGQVRQQDRESGATSEANSRSEAEASDQADHMSALRWEDTSLGTCPSCAGGLRVRGDAERFRPGICLDPFIGSGTTAKVARDHGRHTVGIDLNRKYLELAARRLQQLSLLAEEHT